MSISPSREEISVRRGSAYFSLDLQNLGLDNIQEHPLVLQHFAIVGDELLQLRVLLFDLFAFQTRQTGQAHVQNRLRLPLAQPEFFHEGVFCVLRGARGADDADDLVDIVQRDEQAFQDVAARLGLVQIVLRASGEPRLPDDPDSAGAPGAEKAPWVHRPPTRS